MPTLVLAGGSGFLGRALARHFHTLNWDVRILARHEPHDTPGTFIQWDGVRQGPWSREVDGADAVVNLAGRSVNCRYDAQNMLDIYTSRLWPTRALHEAVRAARTPPRVWLNASSATIYRHALDGAQDETRGELGTGFSVDVCRRWEAAFFAGDLTRTRRVALRTGLVYGPGRGGIMAATDGVVRAGLAGSMAGGRQRVSWIHVDDFVRSVEFLIDGPLAGPVNVCAPHPLQNHEFLAAYRAAWRQPVGIPSAAWMLRVGAAVMHSEAELLLKSRWVLPTRLLEAGFQFVFPTWPEAIQDLVTRAHQETP